MISLKRKFLLCILLIVVNLAVNSFYSSSSIASENNTSIPFITLNYSADDVVNYHGIRLVLFFSPSCPHCSLETDYLVEYDKTTNYSITFFALSVDYNNSNATLLQYRNYHNFSSTWILGFATNETIIRFNMKLIPFIIILDDAGYIVAIFEGLTSIDMVNNKIKAAIDHNIEEYDTKPIQDNNDLLKALFVILGSGIILTVIYFIVKIITETIKTKRIEKKVAKKV